MTSLSQYAPIVVGFALGWFVILGVRELFKEASTAFVKKSRV